MNTSTSPKKTTATAPAKQGTLVGLRDFFRENTLVAGVGLWASVMAGTGVYVARKNIPTQLKVITARMVAQGAVIGALLTVGVLQLVAPEEHEKKTSIIDTNNFRDFSKRRIAAGVERAPVGTAATPAAAAEPAKEDPAEIKE